MSSIRNFLRELFSDPTSTSWADEMDRDPNSPSNLALAFEEEDLNIEFPIYGEIDYTAIKLHETTDAKVWAQEFHKIYPESDIDTVLGWFANAIEVGRSAGISEGIRAEREVRKNTVSGRYA